MGPPAAGRPDVRLADLAEMSSTPTATSETTTVDLKNRWLAAGLALLLPGLGHLYQGRTFKAAIYSVCILGLFFTGQALGNWKVVYLGDSDAGGRISAPGNAQIIGRLLQGYGAQFPVGALAWPAIVQSRRYHAPEPPDAPLTSEFEGRLMADSVNGPQPLAEVRGTVMLEPAGGGYRGKFVGETVDGKPVEVPIDRVLDLGRRVSANEYRTLVARAAEVPDGIAAPPGVNVVLEGRLPRPFVDRYQVPLGDSGEDSLTAELGGRLEIAYVFTWIAGLLNVLAIWDALDGPAYGIGNEPESKKKRRRKDEEDAKASDKNRRPEPIRTI